MMLHVVAAVVLSQYVRSRVDDKDPASQCLWWIENTRIELRQNADGNPDNPGNAEFDAVARSIATWQTKLDACSSLSLVEGAHTTTRKVGYFENETNENVLVFRTRKCADVVPANDGCRKPDVDNCGNQYDCWQHSDAAIAITTTSYNPTTGRILDSDVEYNNPNFLFTTVDFPPCVSPNFNQSCVATDIENTTTHELGHLLGLAHSPETGSTMYLRANPGETSKRTLDANTAKFVCDVYPKGGATKTCFISPVDPVLGKATGCSATNWGFAALGALLLRRRRRT
ncbi:MAG: matrixin family metalloprotease [Archangium sp.]